MFQMRQGENPARQVRPAQMPPLRLRPQQQAPRYGRQRAACSRSALGGFRAIRKATMKFERSVQVRTPDGVDHPNTEAARKHMFALNYGVLGNATLRISSGPSTSRNPLIPSFCGCAMLTATCSSKCGRARARASRVLRRPILHRTANRRRERRAPARRRALGSRRARASKRAVAIPPRRARPRSPSPSPSRKPRRPPARRKAANT